MLKRTIIVAVFLAAGLSGSAWATEDIDELYWATEGSIAADDKWDLNHLMGDTLRHKDILVPVCDVKAMRNVKSKAFQELVSAARRKAPKGNFWDVCFRLTKTGAQKYKTPGVYIEEIVKFPPG
ncbi:MAG: hypothetical protein GYB25_13545 [Rhodobacteraceae bacterium]|nr:hypothetical protein [Paracoccaceae bacterium]